MRESYFAQHQDALTLTPAAHDSLCPHVHTRADLARWQHGGDGGARAHATHHEPETVRGTKIEYGTPLPKELCLGVEPCLGGRALPLRRRVAPLDGDDGSAAHAVQTVLHTQLGNAIGGDGVREGVVRRLAAVDWLATVRAKKP